MSELIDIAEAIESCGTSTHMSNENLEPANLVDVLDCLAKSTRQIAGAITPQQAAAGRDAAGGHVASLTEAVIGVTAGLHAIADAIRDRD